MPLHPDPLRALYVWSGAERRLGALQTASHQTFGDISSWNAWLSGVARGQLRESVSAIASLMREPSQEMARTIVVPIGLKPYRAEVFVAPSALTPRYTTAVVPVE